MKKRSRPRLFPILRIVFLIAVFLFVFSSCSNEARGEKKETASPVSPSERITSPLSFRESEERRPEETASSVEVSLPEEPEVLPPIGIYVQNGGYTLTPVFSSRWPTGDGDPLWRKDTWTYPGKTNLICDVGYFVVLPSNEEHPVLSGDWDAAFLAAWDEAGLTGQKIGFCLEAVGKDGSVQKATVLSPKDTFLLEDCFELYLYDDVLHAHDAWYSHVTQEGFGESTRLTSIKITLRTGCRDLREIDLTAFCYSGEDDFDRDGNYTGKIRYTCRVLPAEG